MEKTLGGDRLGSGNKMKVHLKGYERSTHDKSYAFRSSMAAGTLVPFLVEVGLPGDTFDIELNCDVKTHPTIGPLFGGYKIQGDIFEAPIRLYQGRLHNNETNIGMNMSSVKLPLFSLRMMYGQDSGAIDTCQINPSCILAYLGIRGVGKMRGAWTANEVTFREFNATSLLMYWDIYKNYYSNKQEEIGAVIHTVPGAVTKTVDAITFTQEEVTQPLENIEDGVNNSPMTVKRHMPGTWSISYVGTQPDIYEIILLPWNTAATPIRLGDIAKVSTIAGGVITAENIGNTPGLELTQWFRAWTYIGNGVLVEDVPTVATFPLENIDTMRKRILAHAVNTSAFVVTAQNLTPYKWVLEWEIQDGYWWNPMIRTQEGLGIKTYQSDLFNNWVQTDWIDGPNGINAVTAVSTAGDQFTIDSIILARKVYDMMNRIAVSGGTFDDWQDAVWAHEKYRRCESPIYHGGLIKELVFQEVISNSESATPDGTVQPLGTLAGRGVMGNKHKGGRVRIKVDEPCYIMGIISITPRIDYSQGNMWDTWLKTMDDFHKPALDEIGFQELITEQMAWWSTSIDKTLGVIQKSAGKQPAWINYMTNVNRTFGNFAIEDNEMFMTLNRRYEYDEVDGDIKDLTTYIDPSKFNNIFAETKLDAQNFWMQIGVGMEVRRKMSAKMMPNL